MGGNKRTIAVLAAITVGAAIPVFVVEKQSDDVVLELLAAAERFEANAPKDGSIRFTYDGITAFNEEGWVNNADSAFSSTVDTWNGGKTYMCERVDPARENCYLKVTHPEIGYTSPKWMPDPGLISVGDISVTEDVSEQLFSSEFDSITTGRWSRDGDNYTYSSRMSNSETYVATYTFTDTSAQSTQVWVDTDGTEDGKSTMTWTYDPQSHPFTQPPASDIFTPEEAEAEDVRVDALLDQYEASTTAGDASESGTAGEQR